MLTTLFDHLQPPPPPARQRLRRAPTNEYLHVREVKGGAFQSRPWIGGLSALGIRSLNLGLFTVQEWESRSDAEWAAGRASKEFRRRYQPGVSLRAVLEGLIRDKIIPDHVLPPRVRQAADGTYFGKVRKAGRLLLTPSFACPWLAYEEMLALLAREFPPGPSKSELRAAARARARARGCGERVSLADFLPATAA